MDNAHARLSSPPSSGPASTVRQRQYSPLNLPEQTYSRQQRLLENRNARFIGKRLSMTDIGTKFTQLIHANDDSQVEKPARRGQENTAVQRRKPDSVGKGSNSARSLGILQELSGSTGSRKLRKRGSLPLYQDHPERPLLENSPFSSPVVYRDPSSEVASPIGFDNFHDNLSDMRLREVSGNEHRGSPPVSSPLNGSLKGMRKRKSTHFKPAFDAHEYIDHIEKELQQARQDMFSPNTNKSLRDQLKAFRVENERLKSEIGALKQTFESEVQRTVEHKMTVEAELKMKVRDLEEELELKNVTIRNFEHQHEDKRLDSNTVETLKAIIARLEQDKTAMEDENRNMSKRNEVLSELLAMSPTKSQSFFELKSPVRARKAGRPMSMIMPRVPSSPTFRHERNPSSANSSPVLSMVKPTALQMDPEYVSQPVSDNFDVVRPKHSRTSSVATRSSRHFVNQLDTEYEMTIRPESVSNHSSSPAPWDLPLPTSPVNEVVSKPFQRRKPRKFMSGSTQLKPLLLPALSCDTTGATFSSALTSPSNIAARDFSQESFDPTTYFVSQPSSDPPTELEHTDDIALPYRNYQGSENSSMTHFQTFDTILAQHEGSTYDDIESPQSANNLDSSPSFVVHATGFNTSAIDSSDEELSEDNELTLSRCTLRQRLLKASNSARNWSEGRADGSMESPLPLRGLDFGDLERLQPSEMDLYRPVPAGESPEDIASIDIPKPLFSPVSRTMRQTRLSHFPPKLDDTKLGASLEMLKSCQPEQSMPDVKNLVPSPPACQSDAPVSIPKTKVPQLSVRNEHQVGNVRVKSPASFHGVAIARPKNPLEILQQRHFGARPLAALTIRTIYGTLSRCTGYVHDLKRDPLALARRILANAWFANWARFGRLSWWVLGLFVSPARQQQLLSWDWDAFDGESIAQQVQEAIEQPCSDIRHTEPLQTDSSKTHYITPKPQESVEDSNSHQSPHASKVGWGRSLFLWGKFSIAIMLAVGGAVVKGPGEMLKDMEQRRHIDPTTVTDHASLDIVEPGPEQGINSLRGHQASDESCCTKQIQQQYSRGGLASEVFNSQLQHNHGTEVVGPSILQSVKLGDGDGTLKPTTSQKIHMADVFGDHPGYTKANIEPNHRQEYQTEPPGYDDLDEGIMHWPPSPASIQSDDNVNSTERSLPYDQNTPVA